jgi:hypothetical protein
VELSRPNLTAQAPAGYYDQPFYSDPPDPGIQHLTVAQLEKIMQGAHSDKSVERQLSGIVLSERLSQASLQPLLATLHRKKLRGLLEMIADESTFRDPPSAGISADPQPDQAEQQRILTAAVSYLNRVIPTLPDLFATRTAVPYRELVSYPGLNPTAVSEPLHADPQSKQTVLYRQGKEVLSGARTQNGPNDDALQTYGTFGPILSLLQAVLASPGDVTWGWWENDSNGKRAVFRFQMAGTPKLTLSGCCYPNGSNGARIGISANSHGELVIDPTTGAIYRVQTESDLPGFVPTKRSEMMVSYGPVRIGDRTYNVPVRSVNISRAHSVATLLEWNLGFATWGPYETRMNVFTFDQYHVFRAKARMLPGFEQVPK